MGIRAGSRQEIMKSMAEILTPAPPPPETARASATPGIRGRGRAAISAPVTLTRDDDISADNKGDGSASSSDDSDDNSVTEMRIYTLKELQVLCNTDLKVIMNERGLKSKKNKMEMVGVILRSQEVSQSDVDSFIAQLIRAPPSTGADHHKLYKTTFSSIDKLGIVFRRTIT